MMRGLIEKELRQNFLTVVFLMVALAAGLAGILYSPIIMQAGGSGFEALRMLLVPFMPLACIVLARAVIAGEFRQRTQLFLEGLPLPRWRMLAVKHVLGGTMVVIASALLVLVLWWRARGGELMTPRFLALLLVKAGAWSAFCWSVCFALGFLGRYRVFATLVLVVGLIFAESQGVPVSRFGPFDLIGRRFAFERFVWPVQQLEITALLIAGCTALGFGLGLLRDATVAAMLAERMSAREKVTLSLLVMIALMTFGSVQQRKNEAGPVFLPGAVDVTTGVVTVSAAAAVTATTPDERAAMDHFASQTAGWLNDAGQYLRCESLPTVFLVHRRDFEDDKMEDGDLDSRQGFMLRLNMLKSHPDDAAYQKRLLGQVLRAAHHYRLPSDGAGWALDGFVRWWPERAKADAQYAALTSGSSLPDADMLQSWLRVRRDRGEKTAEELAAAGLIAMGRICGEEPRRRFLSGVLGGTVPHDGRAWLHEVLHPAWLTFERSTNMTLVEFTKAWAALPKEPAS